MYIIYINDMTLCHNFEKNLAKGSRFQAGLAPAPGGVCELRLACPGQAEQWTQSKGGELACGVGWLGKTSPIRSMYGIFTYKTGWFLGRIGRMLINIPAPWSIRVPKKHVFPVLGWINSTTIRVEPDTVVEPRQVRKGTGFVNAGDLPVSDEEHLFWT